MTESLVTTEEKMEILTDVYRRNAMRRQSGLSPLDIRAEVEEGIRILSEARQYQQWLHIRREIEPEIREWWIRKWCQENDTDPKNFHWTFSTRLQFEQVLREMIESGVHSLTR